MRKHLLSLLAPLLAAAITALTACTDDPARTGREGLLEWVDPHIGTGGHGHTFMGASAPFGAVQPGPNNFDKGWDWCSGYHDSDSICAGFSHLHLNGTGCSDTGDVRFMPTVGTPTVEPGSQNDPDSGYASRYSHAREFASPAYYRLHLDDYGIDVELTATERVALHRYTFPKAAQKQVVIDLMNANGGERATEAYLEQTDERTIRGYRFSTGWAPRQRIYFTARFSEPVRLDIYRDGSLAAGSTAGQGLDIRGVAQIENTVNELKVKVGISPVSMEGAARNIDCELPGWDFEATVSATAAKWNRELGKVAIEGADSASRRIFYTALYHAFLQPSLFDDCDRSYRGADDRTRPDPGYETYTVFSLWDTYRAAHPLYTLLQPERVPDMVNTMLAIGDEQGLLPVWHLYGSDTREMIGIQSVPVIADAVLKGFPGIDADQAFEAMKRSMLSDYKGLAWLRSQDYIPADRESESVAKGLEYALADGAVARVARHLGRKEEARLFERRARFYTRYWDPELQFFRGRNLDGSLREPFDPFRSTHRSDDYCEGTAWQYIWLVPHDVEGLVALFGGEEPFLAKLDALFTVEGDMGAEASSDISGLIGQYAHGNEPGHHTAYLYACAGAQWKTAAMVRRILDEMYADRPDGLAGNEDCGQMSSWYALSALGFYPVDAAGGIYVLGSPAFARATVSLPGGKRFTVEAEGNSPENIYIQSASLDGEPYPYAYIRHSDIVKGGTLHLTMGPQPNKAFGAAPEHRPYIAIN